MLTIRAVHTVIRHGGYGMKALLGLAFAFCATAYGLNINQTSDKYQFKAQEIKSAVIHNSTGNLHIAPVTTKTAYVVLNKVKWGQRCSSKVDLKNGVLTIETDDTAWIQDHECRVDLIVSLPNQIPLQVRTGTGDVQIVATRGDVDVKVGSGLISVKGDIIHLKALSGSGDVRLIGQAQTADIKTGTGDIELDYSTVPAKGSLALRTGSGDVDLSFPETANLKTQISAGNGTVTNEFAISKLEERINIKAASATGNINIRKK